LTFVLFALVANIVFAQQPPIEEEKNKNSKPVLADEKFVKT